MNIPLDKQRIMNEIRVYIVNHPGCSLYEVAEAVSMSPQDVAVMVKLLRDNGLIKIS